MNEIIVTSQEVLDQIPEHYNGKITINFGTEDSKAIIKKDYEFAKIDIIGNSHVELYMEDYTRVYAYEQSHIDTYKYSYVVAHDRSVIKAYDQSMVDAFDNSKVYAYCDKFIEAWDKSYIEAYGNCHVYAEEETSHIEAHNNVCVEGINYGNIICHDNSYISKKEL